MFGCVWVWVSRGIGLKVGSVFRREEYTCHIQARSIGRAVVFFGVALRFHVKFWECTKAPLRAC